MRFLFPEFLLEKALEERVDLFISHEEPIPMPFISVGDIRIYYEIQGKGPRLLVISGTGGDLRRKPSIFESPLAAHFEILAYDQRGLGRTDKPDIPYSMADYAADAAGLLDALGWNGCSVLGISFGGMVAQEFAIRYPSRVKRMVLACSSCGGPGGSSYPLHKLVDLTTREKAVRLIEIMDARRDAAWRKEHPEQYRQLLEQMVQNFSIGADEKGRKMGDRRQLEARKGHDTCSRLSGLTMPVFICGGLYDANCPVKSLEWLHGRIPHAQFELFEGGHLFFLQDPRAFKRMEAFLKGDSNCYFEKKSCGSGLPAVPPEKRWQDATHTAFCNKTAPESGRFKVKTLRSILKKGMEETPGFEGPSSQWEGLNPHAFETEPAGREEKGQGGFVVDNQPIEPGSGKTVSSGFLKWIFFIVLIGYMLFSYYRVPILTWAGSLLVMEHPVKRADLIVCTPGDPFEVGLMAADLYKKKMANRIFIPETPLSTAHLLVNEQGGNYPTSGELLLAF